MNEVTLGTTTAPASMLGEILGPGTSRTEEDLRGCDRSRLLETTSTLGEVLGDGTIAAPGRALGCCTSSRETLARGSTSERPKFSSSSFFLEQGSDLRLFRQASHHTAPTKLSLSSARHVSHFGRVSPNFLSLPHVSLRLFPTSELIRSGSCRPPGDTRWSLLGNVEQERRVKSDRRCRTSQESRGTRYHSRTCFGRALLRRSEA